MDPKKILGVPTNATAEEIQQAYRKQAKKHHPDLGGDSWAFQQVQQAYEALTGGNPKPVAPSAPAPRPPTPPSQTAARQKAGSNQNRQRTASQKQRTQQRSKKETAGHRSSSELTWKNLFIGQLPLQTETTTFILFNCLDIFLTYALLRNGAIEANPIADYVMHHWGFQGAIIFKLAIVTFVAIIAQIVAIKKLNTARFLLITGTLIVGCVVVYSISLYLRHFT